MNTPEYLPLKYISKLEQIRLCEIEIARISEHLAGCKQTCDQYGDRPHPYSQRFSSNYPYDSDNLFVLAILRSLCEPEEVYLRIMSEEEKISWDTRLP